MTRLEHGNLLTGQQTDQLASEQLCLQAHGTAPHLSNLHRPMSAEASARGRWQRYCLDARETGFSLEEH